MDILIVEDEILIRDGIKTLLSKMEDDWTVVGEATNGKDGLQLLQQYQPDVVITDIKMPEMDGLEMLTNMRELGLDTEAIVLSAYSEFEYARKAMKLGVTEYLLKPIAFNDFSQALQNVKTKVIEGRQEKPEQIGTLEQIFELFIEGRIKNDPETANYLKNNYNITEQQSLGIVCIYLGFKYDDINEKIKTHFQHAFSIYSELSYAFISFPYRKSLVAILYNYTDSKDLERWLQSQLLDYAPENVSVGWTEVSAVNALQAGFEALYTYMDWSISLKHGILISYPKICQIQTASCIYPIDLESRIKVAISENDWDTVKTTVEDFQNSFNDGKIYAPKEIKECYVHFLWAFIEIAREMGCLDERDFDYQKLIEMIMNAKMMEELDDVSDSVLKRVCPKHEEIGTTHLTVKRAKSMIHEYYQTGITLEDISRKLNVTSEYLGTLFHKEVGVTFSTYMKNCRIDKAKELLCGTELKLGEIAKQVGYTDPKYFSKVFKDVTGMLPTEYRRFYK